MSDLRSDVKVEERGPGPGHRPGGNLRAAEEMLERYLDQRKRPLAELALETVLELAPDHPRRADYERRVAALGQATEDLARLDARADSGRAALRSGDWAEARGVLDELCRADPDAPATRRFTVDYERAARAHAEDASIEERKTRIEQLLAAREVNDAEVEIDALAELPVPKVTLDFLRKRLEEIRAELRTAAEQQTLESVFRQYLGKGGWQAARDVAIAVDELGQGTRAAEMFDEIDRLEAEDRRQRAVEEGLTTVERFIDEGRATEAALALKVLRGLDVDDRQLELYQRRIAKL